MIWMRPWIKVSASRTGWLTRLLGKMLISEGVNIRSFWLPKCIGALLREALCPDDQTFESTSRQEMRKTAGIFGMPPSGVRRIFERLSIIEKAPTPLLFFGSRSLLSFYLHKKAAVETYDAFWKGKITARHAKPVKNRPPISICQAKSSGSEMILTNVYRK